ncbi:hypothetical protein JFX10_05225 (plasmid) [Sinorhizobium meliloti]|nr:hypothetical protein [Sinorhizobium meliloti]QQF01601.1 hypothetical protein JFX10_05225 [Sinorhizobium meliloti]
MSFEVTVPAIRRGRDEPPRALPVTAAKARLRCPFGILGWRHLLTAFVTQVNRRIGSDRDVEDFRADPIRFFRSLSGRKYRIIGRTLYPFG